MKKMIVFIAAFMLLFSSLAFAAGGKNHGEKGQGSTGEKGQGQTTQHSRN